jgi:hypothetical protein
LEKGIPARGYTAPTEVQTQAIPAAIAGKDIIGCAQTGTGKTAALVLPILNRLSQGHPSKRQVMRSLILTPTREKKSNKLLDRPALMFYALRPYRFVKPNHNTIGEKLWKSKYC